MTEAELQATERAHGARDHDFEVIYRRLWPQVARLAHLVAGSRAVGEELAQEAFVGLLRRGPDVRDPAAYLRRSVINLALTTRRRQAFEGAYVRGLRESAEQPPEIDETWQALLRLPPRQRAVLALRFYEDLSEAEIAAVLGCRRGSVKSLNARALTRLRKDIEHDNS